MPFVTSASSSPRRCSSSVPPGESTGGMLRRGGRPGARLVLKPGRKGRTEEAADLAELGAAARTLLGCGRNQRAVYGQPAGGTVQIRHLSSAAGGAGR